jgi:hypothetical protein
MMLTMGWDLYWLEFMSCRYFLISSLNWAVTLIQNCYVYFIKSMKCVMGLLFFCGKYKSRSKIQFFNVHTFPATTFRPTCRQKSFH